MGYHGIPNYPLPLSFCADIMLECKHLGNLLYILNVNCGHCGGDSLTKPSFGVTSAEVAINCPEAYHHRLSFPCQSEVRPNKASLLLWTHWRTSREGAGVQMLPRCVVCVSDVRKGEPHVKHWMSKRKFDHLKW